MRNFLVLVLLLITLPSVLSDHFRGGVIMMQSAQTGNPKEMEISFRISWRRNSGGGGYCNQDTINNGNLIGYGELMCSAGCSGLVTVMTYQCTDFSVSENWSYGERRLNYVFEDSAEVVTLKFSGGNWIYPLYTDWSFIARNSLLPRNDTGKPNSTPRAVTAPVIRLQAGCNHTVKIGVDDPDGDTVRCRWAVGSSECGGICNQFPGAVLDPYTCSIKYEAIYGTDYKGAALMVEDFAPFDTNPLSSISLQFLILVFDSDEPCAQKPEFVYPTITSGQCVAIPSGSTFLEPLTAFAGASEVSIKEIQTASPPGLHKSNVEQIGDDYFINITWAPSMGQESEIHQFCYTALNSVGLSSEQVCIDFIPGISPPKFVSASNSPNEALVFPHNTTWTINCDADVSKPALSAYIRFIDVKESKMVYSIDTSKSSEFKIENKRTATISPLFEFEQEKDFYITLDRGIVTGTEYCKPGNEMIDDPIFWTFRTKDIIPPTLTFTNAVTRTNQNVTLTWTTNEESTEVCELVYLDFPDNENTIQENCTSKTWSGFGVQEGNHELLVISTDTAGNQAVYRHSFYVDTTAPTVQFQSLNGDPISNLRKPKVINQKSATIRYRCWDPRSMRTETCTFECLLATEDQTGNAFIPCPSSNVYYLSNSLAQLDNYALNLTVIAVDDVGNRGDPITFQWKTDFQKPTITANTSEIVPCDVSVDPVVLGYPSVQDDQDPAPMLQYSDINDGCTLKRTWTATDHAGNYETFIQDYTLSFEMSVSYVPTLTSSCDSTSSEPFVSQSTATVPNPCRRSIELTYIDDPAVYTCPGAVKRQWTAIDQCSGKNMTAAQTLVFHDVCPIESCGRNFTKPHGICTYGRCACNKPWYGENCYVLMYEPEIGQISDVTIIEGLNYEQEFTLVKGSQPINWAMSTGPEKVKIDGVSGKLRLFRPKAGNYSFSVEASNQVGQYIMAWTLIVKPTYKVYINPIDTTVFSSAIPIVLSGHVIYESGSVINSVLDGNVPIAIEVYRKQSKRSLTAITTKDGNFTTVFYPSKGEYGEYTAYGKHPGGERGTSSVEWKVMGMKMKAKNIVLSGASIESFSKTYSKVNTLFNDGPLDLKNVTVEMNLGQLATAMDIDIRMNGSKAVSSFPMSASVDVDITLDVTKPLQTRLVIAFTSSQGTRAYCTIRIVIDQILPSFDINPSSIDTRVVKGSSKVMQFNITNTGQATAHSVHGLAPVTDLISLVSFTKSDGSRQIFDLDSGDNAVMDMLVQIPETHNLGYLSASVLISSQESAKLLPIKVLVSSDLNMNLTVTVEDEYTYFAEGNPLVSNAIVRLTNYQRGIKMILTTAEGNGHVTFQNIPEDRYELFIEAPSHQTISRIIITSPAKSALTIFLERSAVTYSWSVKPVQFTETYTVTLEADFETQVPMPVVTVDPREFPLEELEDGFTDQIVFTITNHGLIRAENVEVSLPTNHPFLDFTYSGGSIGHLDALSSVTVTVDVNKHTREKRLAPIALAVLYAITTAYQYYCGEWKTRLVPLFIKGLKWLPPRVIEIDYEPDERCTACEPGPGGPYWPRDSNTTLPPDFTFKGYTAKTFSLCDPCIQSLVGCIPNPNFILAGCLAPLVKGTLPETTEGNVVLNIWDWFGLLTCFVTNAFLGRVKCAVNVGYHCIVADLIPTDRKRRDVKELTSDVMTSMYPIQMSLAAGTELFGDELWLQSGDTDWVNDILKPVFDDSSDLGSLVSGSEMEAILNADPPNGATVNDTKQLLERINNTQHHWDRGSLEPLGIENMASYSKIQNYTNEIDKYNNWAIDRGYISYIDAYNAFASEINKLESWEEEAGLCAVVRIRIEQEIALTRDAFEAKLEIENSENFELTNINLEILITDDETGENSTLKFSIGTPDVSGHLTGIQGEGSLSAGGMGSAVWLIAPYSEAAPLRDRRYYVGGKLQYTLDSTEITVPLLPASIIVVPNPSLLIHYFWEKNVVGDDPFTEDVEPPEPFSLGVAVKNNGSGIAKNMHISSGQPEIVDNEKGLAVKFEVIGSELGTKSGSSSLTVDFGDIQPHSTKIARWWIVSTLQGKFKNYSATFEYTNPLGDPKLSVLDELEIHDLIRNVRIYNEDDGILDFLVNDIKDVFDTPDTLYDSVNLETYPVYNGTVTAMKRVTIDGTTYLKLTGTNADNGWVYFKIEITNARQLLEGTTGLGSFQMINSDGFTEERPAENKWITSSRKKSGLVMRFLHFVDFFNGTSQSDYLIELCSNCTATGQVTVPPPFVPPAFSVSPPTVPATSPTPIMTTAKHDEPTTTTTTKPKIGIIKARFGNHGTNPEQTCHSQIKKGNCMDIRIVRP